MGIFETRGFDGGLTSKSGPKSDNQKEVLEALELVKEALADPIDWMIIWAVAHSADFREHGPQSTEFKTPEGPWNAVGIKF